MLNTNFIQVISASNDLNDKNFIRWCSDHEVIHNIDYPPVCEHCLFNMRLEFSQINTDGVCWRCPMCKCRKSIRYDTWASESNLPLRTLVKILAYWCDERTVESTVKDLGISKATVKIF